MQSEESIVNPLIKVYVDWINCCLCYSGDKIESLTEDLQNGEVLCRLIEHTTGCVLNPYVELHSEEEKQRNVQLVLQFLESRGLEVHLQAEDIVAGDLKTLLDLLWLIILHFEIHNADRAAYQRTVSMGKRFMLEWGKKEVPDVAIDSRGSFAESFQNGTLLTKIINNYSPIEGVECDFQSPTPERMEVLTRAFEAAEEKFGIPATMLSASDVINGNVDEYSLLIYVALLRRKIAALKSQETAMQLLTPEKVTTDDHLKSPENSFSGPPSAPPAGSPLSPSTLTNLVEQQAKSHAAIQALQEELRAATYSPLTPKHSKKTTTTSQPLLMAPLPSKEKSTEQSSTYIGSTLPQDLHFLLSLQDNSFNLSEAQEGNDDGEEKRITSVDRRFIEFMMDAVQKGCITDDFVDKEFREITSLDSRETVEEGEGDVVFQEHNEMKSVEMPMEEDKAVEKTTSIAESRTNLENKVNGMDEIKVDETEDMDNSSQLKRKANEEQENRETTPKSAKRVQFTGLDDIFADRSVESEASMTSTSEPESGVKELSADEDLAAMPVTSTVTWATLNDSVVKSEGQVTPDSLTRDTSADCAIPLTNDTEDDKGCDGDVENNSVISEDDQFMAYLNSIEQSALMYKLQVEEAKIDTLLTLKRKLEDAFEGTPLEQVPLRFREKLHDILHQVAEDQMSKYRDLTAESEAELNRSEREYITRLQDELDELTSENREIKQQLGNLMTNEKEYAELRAKIKELEVALFTMKSHYQYKNGESDFLGEKITNLDKEILGMRMEYEQQLQDLRNENLELQEICIELENDNRMLAQNVKDMCRGYSSPSMVGSRLLPVPEANGYEILQEDEYLNLQGEIENLRIRLGESDKQVKALTVASEADQAVIKSLEGKIQDMECALAHAQDSHSSVLSEVHESHLQLSSTRALLSGYKEEVEAMRRENKLLKSSLEMSENEIKYQNDKLKKRSEPWKHNKRQIWREIHELENILKDVHQEKKNIEKKYVHFKIENEQLNESLKELNQSLSRNGSSIGSPPRSSSCSPEFYREPISPKFTEDGMLTEAGRQTTVVSPWKKSLDDTAGRVSSEGNENNDKLNSQSVVDGVMDNKDLPERSTEALSHELQSLRIHVGSLEAEKAAIMKELEVIRSPRTSS